MDMINNFIGLTLQLSVPIILGAVSYTHLTLPTIA